MTARDTRVFTIPSDVPFLPALANAVLDGFPLQGQSGASAGTLHRWTILLPTRRACGELERVFHAASGAAALLLPRIRPIGDIDEDLAVAEHPDDFLLPDAISAIGRELALVGLIGEWVKDNPQLQLAQEISASPAQLQALATSLAQLIDSLEIEEASFDDLPALYALESAHHREAILDFLSLARTKLPAILRQSDLIGAAERRSRLLRIEASRLLEFPPAGPLIAAGSTGSIPATRALLKSIASLPNGAVVLPGLDLHCDDKSWEEVNPQHPQYILKQLLAELDVPRRSVRPLAGAAEGLRSWLASEIMRPTETAQAWQETIASKTKEVRQALHGVELIELRTRQEEATAIALILRHALTETGKTASLVTPDRLLARRVKSELRRWNIEVDDSGGEPLNHFGGAALVGLLAGAILEEFSTASLNALFHHDLCRFGFEPRVAGKAARTLEIAVFRGGFRPQSLTGLARTVSDARLAIAADSHAHGTARRLDDGDWLEVLKFAEASDAAFATLTVRGDLTFAGHLSSILTAAELIAGPALWEGEPGHALIEFRDQLTSEAWRAGSCSLAEAATILQHHLKRTTLRPRGTSHPQLSILGLLEARLVRPDIMVLAGLNEGTWPAQPDPGPWLNRPMRTLLGMQQPERDIGQTAHDFVQGFGCGQVYLVWSRRDGGDPILPSRWILRLQMLMKSTGLERQAGAASPWQELAARLAASGNIAPCGKPKPDPPVEARPRRISVTRVETLIRDSYAFYARSVLRLEPMDEIARGPDMALRGMLIHAVLGEFLRRYPQALPDNVGRELTALGRRHFDPLLDDPVIASFWWPRFERIAEWFAGHEQDARVDVERTLAEIDGALAFDIRGLPFMLTCRADRIDLLNDGTARIADYKTGAVPSAKQVNAGLAPQLTLEAAMLESGAFGDVPKRPVSGLDYIKLGGDPAGEVKSVKLDEPVTVCARRHLDGLKTLLRAYAQRGQVYLPRAAVQLEDDELDFDHLSRYREWSLSGGES